MLALAVVESSVGSVFQAIFANWKRNSYQIFQIQLRYTKNYVKANPTRLDKAYLEFKLGQLV